MTKEVQNSNFGLTKLEYVHLSQSIQMDNEVIFNDLYFKYFDKIRNFAAKRCQIFFKYKLNDATDMAFAKFHERLRHAQIPDYGELEGYVVTIAVNEYRRSQQPQNQFNALELLDNMNNDKSSYQSFDNLNNVHLVELLAQLCEFCQRVMRLQYWDGFKQAELVDLMGFPSLDAVKKKNESIKKKLRASFLKSAYEPLCKDICSTKGNFNKNNLN